ncbi:MAG: phenylalanine--tRNA ligase subunit alpha [Clostridiales bacterium]|nr:MAG: phenylalanine--tRNA ligase subunit alpha [Clostridiales bacterium]PIE77247.1 MAG: phenylalanine--tRNA ligase subunit alpha [Clostridiales bacterium]
MKQKLNEVLAAATADAALIQSLDQLEDFRIKYMGRKGELTAAMKLMGKLPKEERPAMGQVANEVRSAVEKLFNDKDAELKSQALQAKLESESIDVTMPAAELNRGTAHPLTKTLNEIVEIFIGMGFSVAEGPEVDTVYNNFDALNSPADHPSRSESDTFYITDNLLLRTQTSPVQVRTMKSTEPPIKIISPGRCFRKDEVDATHSPMFHQIEGLVVDKNISLADLKGTLNAFVKAVFGEDAKTKFRPHHFPFTEPSAEMDVSCFKCGGSGCKFCKHTGWIEILGCGLTHPHVLAECGIDTEEYSAFAFGMGLDRIAMLKYEIDDMRLLFENDKRFLQQF